jgi:uncharacterized integral membrane protein
MKMRTPLLLVLLFAVTLFAALNWEAFTAPATLSLLVTTVQAPLGMIMLGLVALLTLLFMLLAGYLQTAALLESRQHAKEIQAQRKLADQAEASRIAELQNLLTSSLMKLEQQSQQARAAAMARLDRLEQDLRTAIAQESAGLAAHIGELEDKLDKLERQGSARSAFRAE